MAEMVILVDAHDRALGVGEKMAVHQAGLLHRAFSIFVLNPQGQIMLQQRALTKYHSGGVWTNTCCSHPRPGESILGAANRRLEEEMGFTCPLHALFSFVYRAELDQGLTEYEFDHVLIGQFAGEPRLNSEEAADWKWIDRHTLEWELVTHPDRYSYWLRDCYPQFLHHLSVYFHELR